MCLEPSSGACFSATIQQSYPVPIKGFRQFFYRVPPILLTQIRFTALPLPVHLSDVSSVVLFRDSSHPIWDVRILFSLAGVLFFLSALGSYYPEFLFFDYGVPSYSLLVAFNFYRVLGGIGVGLASAICPMYIAEIAPSNIRGTLVS